jgi:hypothetical protein
MRFSDLQGLTSLPIEHVARRFRNEDVIAILPSRASAGHDAILVATPSKLAVVASADPSDGHWMTYWAPWDTVRIVDDEASDDGWFGLSLLIGRLPVDARLPGEQGQRALRDFVVAIQDHRPIAISS